MGLFTQGKNQKEIIEVARLCQDEKIMFHFVGNMAGNFSEYWKPLLEDLPKNCVIHGEQDNPLDYYEASDLFYFPSLYELNPLSLKEALSFNLKIITKDLHTYESYYDTKAIYSTDDPKENKKLLINFITKCKIRLLYFDRPTSIRWIKLEYRDVTNGLRSWRHHKESHIYPIT